MQTLVVKAPNSESAKEFAENRGLTVDDVRPTTSSTQFAVLVKDTPSSDILIKWFMDPEFEKSQTNKVQSPGYRYGALLWFGPRRLNQDAENIPLGSRM